MFRSLHGRTERIDLGAAALDSEALRDLRAKLSGSTASARVVVLWCVGPLAGFDLAEVCAAAARSDLTPARIFAECLMAIREADIPVIAAVDGKIMGGSVGIIAACDIVIAGAGAVFQLPEVIAGMVPALIRPLLARRIGTARATYLELSSRAVDAREAHSIGLVDDVADSDLETWVERQVRRILRSSPEALAECKKRDRDLSGVDVRIEMEAAVTWLAGWLAKPGVRESIQQFADGFAPPWFGAGEEQHGTRND